MDTTRHAALDDHDADDIAAAELWQRHLWARELGLDPACVDLLALPPVPPAVTPAMEAEVRHLVWPQRRAWEREGRRRPVAHAGASDASRTAADDGR